MNDAHGASTTAEMVADEVRACLARRRMSANKAAAALGWSQPYIARRMTGAKPFDVADLAALADLLGISVEQFFPPEVRSRGRVINVSTSPLRIAA